MKKRTLTRAVLLSAIALTVAACGNRSNVSSEGTTDNPIFPRLDQSQFQRDDTNFGSWPNWQNVRQIEKGMNKEQLYELIGRPHFSEGLYAVREWDYAFNYREKGEHKICQFKILFNSDMKAQSFFWHPNGCNGNSTYNLASDFLFDFDKSTLTQEGRNTLDGLVNQLSNVQVESIKVTGYTDRLGTEAYNLDLSQRRANTVKSYLLQRGVKANINAVGLGKAHQVIACENEKGQALRDCLRPNRRVEIVSNGGVGQGGPGENGPAPLYQTPAYNGYK